MLRISCLLLLLILPCATAFSQKRIPQFKDYPARGEYRGKNAPVIITRNDRMFRSVLRESAREKPDFAGHYILAAWGCGASCLMGAVIDANTGRVYWLPFTICCWGNVDRDVNFKPIEFRPNSRLVVFTGLRNEAMENYGPHFYEFDGKRFKFIRSR